MEQQIKKLAGHTEHLLDAYLGLRQRAALLYPMLRDERLIVRFSRGPQAEGFRTLRYTLFCSCAQDLVKLTLDSDNRAPSVGRLLSMLEEDAVRRELRGQYSTYCLPRSPNDILTETEVQSFEQGRRDELAREFDEKFRSLKEAWTRFGNQPWRSGFHRLRNKHTAHLELHLTDQGYAPLDIASLGLKWGNVAEAIACLEGLVLELNALVRRSGFMMHDATRQFAVQPRRSGRVYELSRAAVYL